MVPHRGLAFTPCVHVLCHFDAGCNLQITKEIAKKEETRLFVLILLKV